jgi:hypothetical protein
MEPKISIREAFILASTHFLTNALPYNWESMDEELLIDFCEKHKTPHFECFDRDDEESALQCIHLLAEDLLRASAGATSEDWYELQYV